MHEFLDIISKVSEQTGLSEEAVGKGLDILSRTAGSSALGPLKGMVADELYFWQLTRRIRILDRVRKKFEGREIPVESIPKGFFLRGVYESGFIDDEKLEELWANLLASGITDRKYAHPAFVNVLKQLDGREAHVLQVANRYENGLRFRLEGLKLTCDEHPDLFSDLDELLFIGEHLEGLALIDFEKSVQSIDQAREDYIQKFVQSIEQSAPAPGDLRNWIINSIKVNRFGSRLIEACSPTKPQERSDS